MITITVPVATNSKNIPYVTSLDEARNNLQ